ncbi:MAG: RagB/SusD family nutrient uptake outer membrane protein [Bacteroidales bacterium]|jgi:hypothetical protein|nr:RagB/SusD family nutrient uptake outer membrane protein [Bacteroidales bacterium]
MKRIKYYILTAVALTVALGTACNSDYLDKMPEAEGYDFDKVFKDSTNYRNFCEYLVIYPFFLHLQNGVKPYGSYDDITDNSISTPTFAGVPSVQCQIGNYYGMRTNGDAPMSNNATWEEIWKHVRIANNGIRNIAHYSGSETSKNKILGLCYFYRAYAYMELTRRWGGMPYLFAPVAADENMDFPRLSMQETYQLAAKDCDSAAMFLQNVIPLSEFQHPTRIAALAMKSRILLYAASDLARYENGDGENLWEEAALAADYALREAEATGYYQLVDWANYRYIFIDDQEDHYSKEILFGRRASIGWAADAYTNCIRPPGQLGGKYGVAVNRLFVDKFEMQTTGLPIDDPVSGHVEQNPYVNRDPRFSFNVIYNGATVMTKTMEIWQYDDNSTSKNAADCQISQGVPLMGYTQTGYYAQKWMGRGALGATPHKQQWPYIRLAEVYLNFAEAANEAWGNPDVQDGRCHYSAAAAANVIRNRAQMPDVHSKFLNQADFKERVRNERRVELCFEEHRIFDLRRWKIGTQSEYRDIWRSKITRLNTATYDPAIYPTGFKFEKELLIRRIYEDRHNLFVIKLDDTNIGPNFKQNPGW